MDVLKTFGQSLVTLSKHRSPTELLLMLLGAIVVIKLATITLAFVWRTFLRGSTDYNKYGANQGYWAVVTGASDGIGKAYALALAKKGFNVLLASRTRSKLEAVADEIKSVAPSVQTKIAVIDFASANDDDWDSLEEAIAGVDKVGVLVNNAGVSLEFPQSYLEDMDRARDIIEVNIVAVNEVTLMTLPVMLKNAEDGLRALVINVSSFSALQPQPLLAVYGASKAYVSSFSAALAAEYEHEGVDVDCPVPFFVVSKLSKRRRPTLTCPTPARYVRASLAHAGHGDYLAFSPYWAHAVLEFALRHLPLTERTMIGIGQYFHEDIRARALKKMEREKKGK